MTLGWIVLALLVGAAAMWWGLSLTDRPTHLAGIPLVVHHDDCVTVVLPKGQELADDSKLEDTINAWLTGTEVLVVPKGTTIVLTKRVG